MQAGFAMVETGFTRAKNSGNILMKNMMDFVLGSISVSYTHLGVKITSHASVVAETVQTILDVTITWKIEAAGKIDADIAVTKDEDVYKRQVLKQPLFMETISCTS